MSADFIEYRWIENAEQAKSTVRDTVDNLRRRGATFFRATFRDRKLIVEGWRKPPDDQGPEPQ